MTTIYTFAQSAIEDARSAGRRRHRPTCTPAPSTVPEFTGDIPLTFKELTAGLIKTYEESLLQQGRRHNTISAYMRMLRSIFNQAHLQGIPDAISADELFRFVFTGYEPTAKRAISPTLIRRLSQLNLEKQPTTFQPRFVPAQFLSQRDSVRRPRPSPQNGHEIQHHSLPPT